MTDEWKKPYRVIVQLMSLDEYSGVHYCATDFPALFAAERPNDDHDTRCARYPSHSSIHSFILSLSALSFCSQVAMLLRKLLSLKSPSRKVVETTLQPATYIPALPLSNLAGDDASADKHANEAAVAVGLTCGFMGDALVGKSELLTALAMLDRAQSQISGALVYSAELQVDDSATAIEFWELSASDECARLRRLLLPLMEVFFLCYSAVDPGSFENVRIEYAAVVRHALPTATPPIYLVATHVDQRDAFVARSQPVVTTADGEALRERLGAAALIECNAVEPASFMQSLVDAVVYVAGHKLQRETGSNRLLLNSSAIISPRSRPASDEQPVPSSASTQAVASNDSALRRHLRKRKRTADTDDAASSSSRESSKRAKRSKTSESTAVIPSTTTTTTESSSSVRRSSRRSSSKQPESVDDSSVTNSSTTEVAQRSRRYSTLRPRSKPRHDTIIGFMDSLETVVLPETTQRKERVTHAVPGGLRVVFDKNQATSLSDVIKQRAQKLYTPDQPSKPVSSPASPTSRLRASLSRKCSGITERE